MPYPVGEAPWRAIAEKKRRAAARAIERALTLRSEADAIDAEVEAEERQKREVVS